MEMKSILPGSEDAVSLLVKKYAGSVRGMDREDLAQELRLFFWSISDRYDPARGSVAGFLRRSGDNFVRGLIRQQHYDGLFLIDSYDHAVLSELVPCYGVRCVDEYVENRNAAEKARRAKNKREEVIL